MVTTMMMLAIALSTSIMMTPNSLWLWWWWWWHWALWQYWRCKGRRRDLTTVRSSSRSLHRSKNKTMKARTNQPGLKIHIVTNGWEALTVFNSISTSLEKRIMFDDHDHNDCVKGCRLSSWYEVVIVKKLAENEEVKKSLVHFDVCY